MPRLCYVSKNFSDEHWEVIERTNMICQTYRAQGFNLTLRQVYYQFVSRGWIPNSDRSYKRLGGIVNDGRLAGQIDWDFIQDRTRNVRSLTTWDEPQNIVDAVARQFRRELWSRSGQQWRPEVWVEKDALIDIVTQAANTYGVPCFSCRGYVSQSEMWAAGRRMKEHSAEGFQPVVIHLGDHDPSGIDMTRDIEDRLEMFAEEAVEVRRIALNMDQILQYEPPPNPAKLSDARAAGYLERFGDESWELDALEPSVLVELIRDEIGTLIEWDSWQEAAEADDLDRERLAKIAKRWPEVEALVDSEGGEDE